MPYIGITENEYLSLKVKKLEEKLRSLELENQKLIQEKAALENMLSECEDYIGELDEQ